MSLLVTPIRTLCLFLLLSASLTLVTRAQDPVTVDPKIAKVEFENDRIRILRVHYEPHQKFALHEHPAKVAICLSNFHMHRVALDGAASDGTCPAGSVTWREPEKHAVENLDDSPADTVEIELKYARAPATAVPVGGGIPIDPLQVDLEPHHHVLFKNQYVEVMESRIDPGDSTAYHTHPLDTVYVRLSESTTQTQIQGQDWSSNRLTKPGQVVFEADSKQPKTHRVKNAGTTPYRIIVVELLQ